MLDDLDYVIDKIAGILNATYVGSDFNLGNHVTAVSFRSSRLKDRVTLEYCNGLLEGATSASWRADRTEPMLIIFRRVGK